MSDAVYLLQRIEEVFERSEAHYEEQGTYPNIKYCITCDEMWVDFDYTETCSDLDHTKVGSDAFDDSMVGARDVLREVVDDGE